MSVDMSNFNAPLAINVRQQEILQTAISIIADEGYSCLTMRALAKANGITLGALQYHFRTREDLLRGMVDYIITTELRARFEKRNEGEPLESVRSFAEFILDETSGDDIISDRFWPQLWAMQQVEPAVAELLEAIYAEYIDRLTVAIKAAGGKSPRIEALILMSLLEGETLFTGQGRAWESDRRAVRDTILSFIDERYGES